MSSNVNFLRWWGAAPWKRIALGVVLAAVLMSFATVAMPWWSNKYAYVVQWHYLKWSPWSYPENHTGIILHYDQHGNVVSQDEFLNGQRNGLQISYDAGGKVVRSEEFKEGHPWNGICHFWEGKSWIAEYKDGKVYNGAMIDNSVEGPDQVMIYYLNGSVVSKNEFCDAQKIPRTDYCYGLHHFKSQ